MFRAMSEEQTQKGWILKINLKSGSGCIIVYIVRATTRSSLWHLSVTLPSNFRRFADTDSAPALTLLTADMQTGSLSLVQIWPYTPLWLVEPSSAGTKVYV